MVRGGKGEMKKEREGKGEERERRNLPYQ